VGDLGRRLDDIEETLQRGTYRPGMWSRFVADATLSSRAQRRAVADRAGRISETLHRRLTRPEVGLGAGGAAGVVAAGIGIAAVEASRDGSGPLLIVGAALLVVALQPLVKTGVGLLLGIRFSGVYLRGVEPRVKLRFGTYLAAPAASRIVFHLGGTVGSPLGASWAWWRAAGAGSATTAVAVAFWLLVGIQVSTLTLGLTGRGRRLARITSGGTAGAEIRAAFLRRRGRSASPRR
jgi:hypothetical protein